MESSTTLDSTISLDSWMDELIASMSPPARRNFERYRKTINAQFKINRYCFWLDWPIINVIFSFWEGIIIEGFKGTLNPHWGGMAWNFLNDGMKPSLWHTLQCIFHPKSKYATTNYIKGAPKNKREADAA